jgi:hypothetical protein
MRLGCLRYVKIPRRSRITHSLSHVLSLNIGICDLPFDFAQGGESFDFAQDREPVERLVEPFVIWCL